MRNFLTNLAISKDAENWANGEDVDEISCMKCNLKFNDGIRAYNHPDDDIDGLLCFDCCQAAQEKYDDEFHQEFGAISWMIDEDEDEFYDHED